MGKDLPESINPSDGPMTSGDLSRFVFVEGVSPSMRAVEAVIRELALSEVPVLLLGELGAGKHAIAQRIHEMSHRSTQPFRAVSCAMLQPGQLATPTAAGETLLWQGTVFLAEQADLSTNGQPRLFAVLPAGEHHRGRGYDRRRVLARLPRKVGVE